MLLYPGTVTPIHGEDIEISTWTSSPRVVVGSRVEFRCTATTTGTTSPFTLPLQPTNVIMTLAYDRWH